MHHTDGENSTSMSNQTPTTSASFDIARTSGPAATKDMLNANVFHPETVSDSCRVTFNLVDFFEYKCEYELCKSKFLRNTQIPATMSSEISNELSRYLFSEKL